MLECLSRCSPLLLLLQDGLRVNGRGSRCCVSCHNDRIVGIGVPRFGALLRLRCSGASLTGEGCVGRLRCSATVRRLYKGVL